MRPYLLALDQGTASSRAILFDREQHIVGAAQKEFPQYYPREGWVEHDPMEIWSSQYGVMMEVLAQSGVDPTEIAAIGITNQRETTILWDRETGRAHPQRHRLAVPPHRAPGGRPAGAGPGRSHPPGHRPGPRRLFLGHQDPLASGPCGGSPGAGRTGPSPLRHGGHLATLETHRRGGPCHRLHQCLPHHALRPSTGSAGTMSS